MSIRSWLFAAAALCLPAFAYAADAPASSPAETPATKIVLIGQKSEFVTGDQAYFANAKILAKCLEQNGKHLDVHVFDAWPIDDKILDDAKAIVLINDNGGKVLLDPKHAAKADALTKKGVGLVAIHGAVIADEEVGEKYQQLLGAYANKTFSAHLTQNVSLIVQEHATTSGLKNESLREHYYLRLRFLPDVKNVLTTTLYGKDYPIAWAYERKDGGRSFGFVGGRYHASYANAQLRRTLTNGILWAAKQKIPDAGAKVDIKPEDLELVTAIVAEFVTNKGVIRVNLYADQTPLTCANFVNLAQRGYYDGLKFHRVIANFMIQGGCPEGTGRGNPGYKFEDEFVPALRHSSGGILSMANAGPGTNGSQFFITHNATPHLDGKHTVFGKVVSAKDQAVVDSIQIGDKIETIRIIGDTSRLLESKKDRVAAWNKTLDAKFPKLKKAE